MEIPIKVPVAGESVVEATVARIIKRDGSYVTKEEEILEFETDKVNQTLSAPESGTLTLTVREGDTVAVGEVIGTVTPTPAPASASAPAPSSPSEGKGGGKEKGEETSRTEPAPPPSDHPPLVKGGEWHARRSKEEYVASLRDGGRNGEEERIPNGTTAVAKMPPPQESTQRRKRMSGLRQTIAKRLVEVKNRTAMLTTFNEVDMSMILQIRQEEKEAFLQVHGIKLGMSSFFVKATVSALRHFPDVHAFIEGEEIVYNEAFHIGLSVSTDRGLMVPVIRDCDRLSFVEIEKAIKSLAEKARSRSISIDELKGGSFTVTNGGIFGSMLSTPILNPPQSAILGMHNIVKRPVVVEDTIVIRPIMYLALSYDHRIIDGKDAVSFLVHIKELLEKPERLFLDF
ncbi:MAG: 2-oxoglutarate dehydrogenase complex dihydrolipoyllysine-residue succinyltransferase [Simkaniaceae bacterium]|nr:2-oxoglutarate dehydrogenase complex dihydrolipoyllysine-residue succinyltransferase [Simkaniaceae bacterium]